MAGMRRSLKRQAFARALEAQRPVQPRQPTLRPIPMARPVSMRLGTTAVLSAVGQLTCRMLACPCAPGRLVGVDLDRPPSPILVVGPGALHKLDRMPQLQHLREGGRRR